LNPSNNLLPSNTPHNPLPSKSTNKNAQKSLQNFQNFQNNNKNFQMQNKPQNNANQDLSKMVIEKNSDKKDFEEGSPNRFKESSTMPLRDSDDKNKKMNNKSPKNTEKKVIPDTIYIKNIPNYYNSVETLSKFYKKFGSIENIQVEQNKMLASIKFMKPLDAVKAVNSNKKLFGKEDIFVTLYPDKEPTKKPISSNLTQNMNFENKNNGNKEPQEKKELEKKKYVNSLLEGKFSKFQEIKNKKEKEGFKEMIKKKLANKLKFLLYLKNRIENKDLKNDLINEINKIKNYKIEIEKGIHDDNIKDLLEKENADFGFDYTLIINNLPETMLNYSVLQTKLEVFNSFFF